MRAGRWALGAAGMAIAAFGVFTLMTTLRPDQLFGLAIWLAGAIVAHDAILVPLAHILSAGVDRTARRLSRQTRSIVRIGAVVGGVLSLAVLPEIYAKSLGPANPTILAADYALRLAIAWAIIAVLVVLVSAIMNARTRRTFDHRSATLAPPSDRSDSRGA
ncbi:MAG: hypothetical protein ACOH19_11100 [Rhodoglobus sp.]